MAKKLVYRVMVRPEIELLVVGETEKEAIEIATKAAQSGEAECEVEQGWKKMSWKATPVKAVEELREDEQMSLPWGGDGNEMVEIYLGQCRCKYGCRCND